MKCKNTALEEKKEKRTARQRSAGCEVNSVESKDQEPRIKIKIKSEIWCKVRCG